MIIGMTFLPTSQRLNPRSSQLGVFKVLFEAEAAPNCKMQKISSETEPNRLYVSNQVKTKPHMWFGFKPSHTIDVCAYNLLHDRLAFYTIVQLLI